MNNVKKASVFTRQERLLSSISLIDNVWDYLNILVDMR